MENNISKILDAILSRTAFNLTKRNIHQSYKDHLALCLLQEEGSMAYRLLATKLKEWELLQIPIRIERLLASQPHEEQQSPAEYLISYRDRLQQENNVSRNISTAHLLYDIVADTTTATSQVLSQFGINAHTISSLIREIGDRSEGLFSPIRHTLGDEEERQSEPATNSILNSILREKNGWVYGVECGYTQFADTGLVAITLGCDKANIDKCLAAIDKEIVMSDRKLKAAKKQLLGQLAISSDNGETQCLSMGKGLLAYGKVSSGKENRSLVEGITAEDVREMAIKIFDKDKVSRLIYI